MGRLLVVDADLNKRLATELQARGRQAIAASELEVHRLTDEQMLSHLAARLIGQPWVLVTGDDKMPDVHGHLIVELGLTVATIDPVRADAYRDAAMIDPWRRECAHRWAHWVADQPEGRIERLSIGSHRPWARRRR